MKEDRVLRVSRSAWIVVGLCMVGFSGCSNTQGTAPQVDKSTRVYRSGVDDNQNNGAGSGTTEKPASSTPRTQPTWLCFRSGRIG